MRVTRLRTIDDLAVTASDWNALSRGVPFRRHEWLATWWLHYGESAMRAALPARNRGSGARTFGDERTPSRELYLLAVHDAAGQLIGLAPWYLERSLATGRTLRFLGDGEVCSDHVSLLAAEAQERCVAACIAEHLDGPAAGAWDAIVLEGVDASDGAVAALADELAERKAPVAWRQGLNTWRLTLPSSWDAYLRMLSRSHRGLMRRLGRRMLDTGRAVPTSIRDESGLADAWRTFVDLHQRRRQSLGESGCFSSVAFNAFHEDVSRQLARSGMLQLDVLSIDGVPAAAGYGIVGGNVLHVYQTGVAPDLLHHDPGRLEAMVLIRTAIDAGLTAIDFLRGDEAYKAHLRAKPSPSVTLRIAAPRPAARWRHRAWLATDGLRRAVRQGLAPATKRRT